MEGMSAGLAALAFWGFVAAVVVGGMWYSIREKETRQETLRRIIESGRSLDDEMAQELLLRGATNDNLDRDLKVSGIIVLPIAVGLGLFGVILGLRYEDALLPMLGGA